MRNHNYLNEQVLKILMIIGLICISNNVIYGQDEMQDAIVTVSFSEENETKMIKAKAKLPIRIVLIIKIWFFIIKYFN